MIKDRNRSDLLLNSNNKVDTSAMQTRVSSFEQLRPDKILIQTSQN